MTYLCIFFLFINSCMFAFDTTISLPAQIFVSLDRGQLLEQQLIQGKIEITHAKNEHINTKSFRLGNEPLDVTFIQEDSPESRHFETSIDALIVSIYRFSLPGRKEGIYTLPEIQVHVGKQVIQSSPVTYQVLKPIISDKLKLTARMIDERHIFKHELVIFEYKIYFQGKITLTKEDLPLLNFPGFQNIGTPIIETNQEDNYTVQTIQQTAKALQPGTYRSSPSELLGFLYTRPYEDPLFIRAIAAPIEVTIEGYPENSPLSFNGALGIFHAESRLLTSNSVQIGDFLKLELLISGSGEFETVQMPTLTKQKIVDLFEILPIEQEKYNTNKTKQFIFQIRPKRTLTSIPSIEFSSLDPISGRYVISNTDPISIYMQSDEQKKSEAEISNRIISQEKSILLTKKSKDTFDIIVWLTICCITVSFFLFFSFIVNKKNENLKSYLLFLQASKEKATPAKFCCLLTKALLEALLEKGLIPTTKIHPHELSNEGLLGEIRAFLLILEKKQFLGLNIEQEIEILFQEASLLYHQVRGITNKNNKEKIQ